ncbi:uncharacterized protein LOC132047393 [Lycium ferocissimum]|uniref:uncharacterized protein LOC132047393 n=1 Tax=Lycium ferocissimum TaxID=112874 RepID=UPI0028157AB3|nr:uncharacterized protein LOC132047393 [Lycium ferocissimum]
MVLRVLIPDLEVEVAILARLEWKGVSSHTPKKVISFLKARRMVEKRCLAYLAYVRHNSANIPPPESVPLVREFLEVFLIDLPDVHQIATFIGACMVRLDISKPDKVLAYMEARSSLLEHIRARQFDHAKLCKIRDKVLKEKERRQLLTVRVLRMKGGIYFPKVGDFTSLIMEDTHSSRYSIHSGATKMYRDLKQHYWWCSMKTDIAGFMSRCLNCQQVKYEHQKLGGITQRMLYLSGNRKQIAMDVVVGLPWTLGKFDAIWVIVDRLTKLAHFVPV